MFKPDLIVTWPRNTDYPLWRQFIRDNRTLFEKIIIVFHETNQGYNFREFVTQAMTPDNITFVETDFLPSGDDWRNWSVNNGLRESESEWIFFTEQDFFPKKGFWQDVQKGFEKGAEVIFAETGGRMHPCCIFIKKSLLNRTHKDFSARPDEGYDHFGRLQKDLTKMDKVSAHVVGEKTYKHYNGLSHNFRLMAIGEDPNYEPRDFLDYLTKCMQVKVPLDSRFVSIVSNYIEKVAPDQEIAQLQ